MKKKAPALHAVPHRGLPHRRPAQDEGERWRAEEREGRRGRRSERDERGSGVRRKAPPRWVWPAIAPHRGPV